MAIWPLPKQDWTEHCIHTVIDVAQEFDLAIADANSVSRAIQIRERIGACVALLTEVENKALKKMDSL